MASPEQAQPPASHLSAGQQVGPSAGRGRVRTQELKPPEPLATRDSVSSSVTCGVRERSLPGRLRGYLRAAPGKTPSVPAAVLSL